ncbi:ribosome maturation factor RimM [Actinokineospora pegani]|uniref:ribosome maturation factor RimM n=1 Tax=Actinokineospora pegani TaxID=2654637 RepID=UPI0012E9F5DE|nr:ribosome maturation factor RimM [Actinokineospora pegani]
MSEQNLVAIGRVAKAHGIHGELAVEPRTDVPEQRFALGATMTARPKGAPARTLTVATVRSHTGRLLVRFEEVPDRTAAEALRGAVLVADTADLPPTESPDEFYDHELEGLAAELVDGTRVGTVREITHGSATDLLVLDVDGREVLVPFVSEIVPTVDVAGGRIVLDPPEGLLDLESL